LTNIGGFYQRADFPDQTVSIASNAWSRKKNIHKNKKAEGKITVSGVSSVSGCLQKYRRQNQHLSRIIV
jgi:hypothetical protein